MFDNCSINDRYMFDKRSIYMFDKKLIYVRYAIDL